MKQIARHIFDHALRESSIRQAFARHLHCERSVLRICEDLYDLNAYSRVFVIAIGKAAHTMLVALHEIAGTRFEGIVASPVEPEFQIRGFRYFLGGHPLPKAESIRASGPTMPDSTTTEDCYALVTKYKMEFPPSVQELFERHALDETPKSDDPAFSRTRWWTILSNSALLQAAKEEAERQGFEV